MSKSIKLKDDVLLDSCSIVHNRKLLSEFLNKFTSIITFREQKTYESIYEFLEDFKTFEGYKIHVGYIIFSGENGIFIGFHQTYLNGYGKVLVLSTWHSYVCHLNNGNWTISNITTS